MKKILYIVFAALLLAGCDEFIMDIPHTAPYARTGDVLELDGLSVTLSGSFGNMETEYGVLCFYVSEYEDFSTRFEYMVDIRDYEALDSGKITAVFDDLMPNRTYYYKFGVVHGKLENEYIDYISRAEVWGDVKTFETEKMIPRISRIICYDYAYSYREDEYARVTYDLAVELDSPISGYVDADCSDYGFYAVAYDDSFQHYVSDIIVDDSGKVLEFSISFDRDDYTMSRSPEYCYAITSDCEVGLYMIGKNGSRQMFSEMSYDGFEYTLQPRIGFVDLKQGKIETGDFGDEDHNWDRSAHYEYSLEMEGALFFDTVYEYNYGSWTENISDDYYDWKDGEEYKGSWVISYNSNKAAHINYIFVVAEISDYKVSSYNSIEFYFDGYGGCEITTSYYVPTPSYSKTKASDFGEYDYVSKCESVSIK